MWCDWNIYNFNIISVKIWINYRKLYIPLRAKYNKAYIIAMLK